jgi:hypothetical protein|tara:strand:- start:425 stop:733 length:309 start_codon:yes stop_codon:yes gene_type:complete
MIKKIISKSSVDTVKNIIIGFLIGTVIALCLTTFRFYIDKEAAEKRVLPPAIKHEVPKDLERAKRNMPIFPTPPLTEKEFLSIVSLVPDLFTDEEIIKLLIK